MSDSTPSKKERPTIHVSIEAAEAKKMTGLMCELVHRRVGVDCPIKTSSELPTGARVTLTLTGDLFDTALNAVGHVESVRSQGKARRIRIRLKDTEDFETLLKAGAGRHFNRRGAYRVTPDDELPVIVEIETRDAAWSHSISALDISESGLAIQGSPELDEKLQLGMSFALNLKLPNLSQSLRIIANVRYKGDDGGTTKIGFDFDPTETPNISGVWERVTDYVMRRQRSLLRHPSQPAH